MIKTRSERNSGFTLVEVMVALVIAGLSLAAVAASISQMVDAGSAMRERTYASWIAQNKIAELRLANVVPEVSSTTGEIEYAAQDWAWRSTIAETDVENLYRVDVEVSYAGSDQVIRSVTGFIGEPGVPGQGNRAWTQNFPGAGQDAGEEK